MGIADLVEHRKDIDYQFDAETVYSAIQYSCMMNDLTQSMKSIRDNRNFNC